jgi:Na+/glutamate symporter
MTSPPKTGNWLTMAVILLVLAAALAPTLIGLADALLPLVVVLAIAVVVLRLVFVHTRRF